MKTKLFITGLFMSICTLSWAQIDSVAVTDSFLSVDSLQSADSLKKPKVKAQKKPVIPRDSLILNNGDIIRGEIKDMNNGVITIETNYSDEDLKIEWAGVDYIFAHTYFFVTFSNGQRFRGNFVSAHKGKASSSSQTGKIEVNLIDIVYIKSLDQGFWNRLSASLDLGFNLTKANNLQQISLNSKFGYLADKWSADSYFNVLGSTQDEVDPIQRNDAGLTFKYFLPKDKFLSAQVTLLHNTEQKLDLRTTGKLGVGQYIVHTNKNYLSLNGGGSFNNEKFSTEENDRQSVEAYFGSELNLYDMGDLSLLISTTAYRSLTESKRWRGDFIFDLQYDLPLDFYIKLNVSANLDNQPVEGASAIDYVIQTNFGWEL